MLYTILPLEYVYSIEGQEGAGAASNTVERLLVIDGRKMICKKDASGQLRIERLLSTDPNDFLASHWQPGSLIGNGS